MKVSDMMTSEDIKRLKSQTDLPLLIEHYRKEIWEWKQKESRWLSDKNLLEGSKKTIDELANKLMEISKELAQEKVDREYDKAVHAKELEKALQR
jgi:hypothetical protein